MIAVYVLALALLASVGDYRRQDWRHWTDDDRDCQDTRQEVLIAESLIPATLAAGGCRVLGGVWVDPYTGAVVRDPRRLDVDHVVPLANAHRSGGAAWPPARKRAYANDLSDPAHLDAVLASENRRKGDRGPEAWRPPDRARWCGYARAWLTIKERWRLTLTAPEARAVVEMLATCEN